MPTMNIPGIGSVDKKYVYIGGAVAVGVVGYAYYAHRKTTADMSTATDGTDTTAVDPSAADQAATYEAPYYDATADYSYPGGSNVYIPPFGSGGTPVTGQAPTNNSEWNQAAEQCLQDRGTDGAAAGSALGRYLAGLCLSDAQADMIRNATGCVGLPPQGTFRITICTTPPTDGGGSTTPGTKPAKVTGLHSTAKTKSSVTLAWSPAANATHYRAYRSGVSTNIGDSGKATSIKVGGLRSNTTYSFHVRAWNGDVMGDSSATIKVKTSK